jgi:hypothetical protein
VSVANSLKVIFMCGSPCHCGPRIKSGAGPIRNP